LLRSTGIDQVDLNGQVQQIKSLNFPVKDPANFDARPKLKGHSNVAVVMHNRQLLVTQPSGQTVTIISEPNSYIYDFALSPNGQQIAYLVTNDSFGELWVSHFNGQNQQQLFVVEDKHLVFMAWSPDSQTIIVGWSYPGTNVTGELTPVWINTNNGQITSLGIDQINVGLTFSADGGSLYYGRSTFYDDFGSEQGQDSTTFYELEVK
jgi:WD40 repeat protein